MYRKIEDIRNDIKLQIKKNNIKQEDIAVHLGVTQGQVSRVINGLTVTNLLKKICIYVSVCPYADEGGYDPLKDESFVASINLAVQRSPARAKKIQEILKATAGI